jgi:PEGA domain-containing protein
MKRYWKVSAIALVAFLTFAPIAAAQRRVVIVRRPPVVVVQRPYYWGYGWYDPFWGPRTYYYDRAPYTGDVKLETKLRDALVYIDGGYVGTVDKEKRFSLTPGTHDIELRNGDGHTFFQESVYVIAGKTIKVHVGYSG